jgi:hypothetical protein
VPKQTIIVSNVPSVLGAVLQENCLNGKLDTAVKVLYTTSKETFIIGLSQPDTFCGQCWYIIRCRIYGKAMEWKSR